MLAKLKNLVTFFTPIEIRQRVRYRQYLKNKVYIDPFVEIQESEIGSTVWLTTYCQVIKSTIGSYSSIGRYSVIRSTDMGKYCSISWNVTVGATNHPYTLATTHTFPYMARVGFTSDDHLSEKRVTVGHDVWVGCNSVILPGVTLGSGAVVGAGSVVTGDVPEYAVVTGAPARIIKYRFDEKIRERLLTLQWWDLPEEVIKKNIGLFQEDLSESVLNNLEALKDRQVP